MSDPTIDRTMHAIDDAARAVSEAAFHVRLTRPEAARALDYLDAIVPSGHPARSYLLEIADKARQWTMYGEPERARSEQLTVLVDELMTKICQRPVEVYTITNHDELSDKLPDYWHESGITVRLLGVSDAISGSYEIDTAMGAGYMEPTLVLFDDGLPIAQINLGKLLEMASTPPMPASGLADRKPGKICSIRNFNCSSPSAFLVGPHHTAQVAADLPPLAPCAEHLAYATRVATESFGSELVEVRALPQPTDS